MSACLQEMATVLSILAPQTGIIVVLGCPNRGEKVGKTCEKKESSEKGKNKRLEILDF